MKKVKLSIAVISLSLMACSESKETASNQTESEVTTVSASEKVITYKQIVTVQHGVADFEKWQAEFNSYSKENHEPAGITTLNVQKSIDKPNSVNLLLAYEDQSKLDAFLGNPELKAAMEKAGVTSKPEFRFYDVVGQTPVKGAAFFLISHKVADYEQWKSAFDEHASKRAEAGINMIYLLRDKNDPNEITAFASADNRAAINAFLGNPKLKEAMEKAGVISKPVITILENI